MTYLVDGSRFGPQAKWALTLCSGVLFVDIARLLWAQQGLAVWTRSSDGLAFWSMALPGFALFVSLVQPVLGAILRRLGWEAIALLPSFLCSPGTQHGRPLGHVAEHDLLELALQENSDFLLDWYQHHQERRQKREAFLQTLGDGVFGCLLLVGLDWAVPWGTSAGHSMLTLALGALEGFAVPVVLATLLGACWLLKRTWFVTYVTNWVYYSPLDLTLRAEAREARDRD